LSGRPYSEDLKRARQCLILETDLHLLFLCVPPDPPAEMDANVETVKVEAAGAGPVAAAAASAAAGAPCASVAPRATDDGCWLKVGRCRLTL